MSSIIIGISKLSDNVWFIPIKKGRQKLPNGRGLAAHSVCLRAHSKTVNCAGYSWLATTCQSGHVRSQYDRIFSRRIYMKVEFGSQTRETLFFLDHSWWHACRDATCKPAILFIVGTHQSNDSYYERKHTTPCRGLDCLGAFHKSCPRLPLILPVIAIFGVEVGGTVIFVYFPRRAEMPTSGDLKSGDSLFCTSPHLPPPSEMSTHYPRPQSVRVPTGLCIKTRLSAQPLIRKWFFIFMQIKLIFTRKAVDLASFSKWPLFFWHGNGLGYYMKSYMRYILSKVAL